jgi:DNA-binding PadR family transcriptional regulator
MGEHRQHHDHTHDHAPDDWPGGRRGRGGRRGPGSEPFDRRGARRGEFGWGGPGGPGGAWYGGPRFGGRRRPRGDVRAAILVLLDEQPMHGYQIIQEITERSGGRWQPSPGSVYPTLQALQDGGLVTAQETEGKRVHQLTDDGRAALAELGDRAREPWDLGGDDDGARALAEQMAQFGHAFHQVLRAGSPDQQAKARTVIADARRALYQILAEDPANES